MGVHFSSYYSYYSTPATDVLNATCGPVRGLNYQQPDGRSVGGYLGIPYAKPPVGERRFKKPEAHERWETPRDCYQFGPRCPQNDEVVFSLLNAVGKDEANCLTLNVFAPLWKSDEWPNGLPVMVYIHGGGFVVHSSSNYGDSSIARNLCVKDIVVVSINYRLGIFGFFTTGDDVCRGNFGLWDQTLALKWVQEHIASFGGDPKNVTIFGQSAGGASVDLLSLSPHSRDLFQRVIPMAGCAECDFALRTSEQQATISREYSRFIGWTGKDDDSEGLMRWINEQPLHKLELSLRPVRGFESSQTGSLCFVPHIDGDFFPKSIPELRKESPKRSILVGTTEFEGLFFAGLLSLAFIRDNLKKLIKDLYKKCDYGDQAEAVQEKVFNFYMKDIDVNDKTKCLEQMIHFLGDHFINVGVFNYARSMAKMGHDVYFYSFEHFNPNGFGIFKWIMPFVAATHCMEIRYVLGKGVISKFKPDEDDLKMIHIMTNYFTNFAKYGTPNSRSDDLKVWEKHSPENPFRHLRIKLPTAEMVDDYQARRAEFWDEIRAANVVRGQHYSC
ncbi:unnamed protein product [Caenorhabditis auriculariae]|uniref:Carboxylic ester hydrolase n=1 Tax=Caenorhabditis auriculariae TaxID=2777116 RepID=A0A8S1H673_9PELO|nr:unnamed protein product [Caenorhabditis auriculariae]